MKNIRIAHVNTLAAQIRRANGMNRSESMKLAFATLRRVPCSEIVVFTKKGQAEIQRRVVCRRWFDVQPPVGGRSTVTAFQTVFADLAKFALGQNCIIAPLTANIISAAA